MQFKTGTRISLLFALFSFILTFLLLFLINIYTLLGWHSDEKKEVIDNVNKEYKEILDENNNPQAQKKELLEELKDKGGFIGDIKNDYKIMFLDLYKKENIVYIITPKNTKFGNIYIPYDVTGHLNAQINLLYISIIGLLFFTFLSFVLSKILFIRLALKDMFLIQKHLKNINFKKIEKIPLNLDKTDEIYEIINSINKFLELIEKNTKNLHEFNSIVSHEFKTPLMIMSSQIEFAYKTQKYDESLIKIEKQIDLLNNLLETFLFISKLQNSGIKLKLNKLDISQITENLASEYAQIYSHKNINLSLNISKGINIKTDEKLFHLIIKNLIDNSFKYTNESGNIEIYLDENKFYIKDDGIGINKEKLDNIFETFYREKNDEKGYGIGLNIVKKSIEILHYNLSIETEKGNGSKFIINFK